jgi:hypothetical protein
MKVLKVLFVIISLSVGLFAAYSYGVDSGTENGRNAMASEKDKEITRLNQELSFARSPNVFDTSKTDLVNLRNDYNALVTDYNNLRNAVIQYAGSVSYQARQPITCNSYSYSESSVTTRCY